MIEVAVLGHGVVGSGVCEVLEKNAAGIADKAGAEIRVKKVLDLRDFPDCPYRGKFTKDYQDILGDPDIKVVAEVMGGVDPAFSFTKSALEAGKSVVTSNKELVAVRGAELLRIAAEHNVNFLFEASVGGGIPIIRPLHQCLAANQIDEIVGILNGTTNFILTKMIKEKMAFDEALKLAQELGYAERDPSADVGGHDACRKICILASLAFGKHIYPDSIYTQGITELTPEDVLYAASADCVIKLIGRAYKTADGKTYALVSPALISRESPLAGVDDVFNGILVRGNATGDVVFYGKGAGKLPTASAVVGDIIDCVKAKGTNQSLHWADGTKDDVADYLAQEAVFYVRCAAPNAGCIERVFGRPQYLSRKDQPANEYAFITPAMPESELNGKLGMLEAEGARLLGSIRILDV